jgi:hypothetical protein
MSFISYIPDDGYTEPGYIAPVTNLHDGLRFHYRPITVPQQSLWDKTTGDLKGDQWARKTAEIMAQRLLDWSLVDRKGEAIPITNANVLRLKPSIFSRLHTILWGSTASDPDPEWTETEKNEATDTASQASISGMTVGAVREAENEKNSGPG